MSSLPPFQRFLDAHRDDVLRFLVASLGRHDADDAFQETFLSALRAYERLRPGSNLRAWVLTIAHNKALDVHRARARRPLPVAEVDDGAAPVAGAHDRPDGRRRRALGARPRAAAAPARGAHAALRRRPDARRDRAGAALQRGGRAPRRLRRPEDPQRGACRCPCTRLTCTPASRRRARRAHRRPRRRRGPRRDRLRAARRARRPARRRRHAARARADRLRARERRRRQRARPDRRAAVAEHRRGAGAAWTACAASSTSTSPAAAATSTSQLDWRLARLGVHAPRPAGDGARSPSARRAATATSRSPPARRTAFRAAGGALGSNPIPIVVPCHRVLASGGEHRRLHRRPGSQARAARHRGGPAVGRLNCPLSLNSLAHDSTRRPERPRRLPAAPADQARHQPVRVLPPRRRRHARRAALLRRAEALQVQGGHPLLHRRVQDPGAAAHQGAPALRPARDLRRHRRASAAKIGEIQKVFGASLLRSTYRILGAGGEELAITTEKSLPIAIFRRAVGFIPYVENVADWLPIPYHFVFKRGEQIIGHNTRQTFKIRDNYTIDMTRRQRSHPRPPPRARDRRRHGRPPGSLARSIALP